MNLSGSGIDVLNEQRQAVRKVLKVKAVLEIDDAPAVTVRTVDVAQNGMCVATAAPVRMASTGKLVFVIYHDGQGSTIHARVKSTYCVFSNGEFKIGFQFTNLGLSDVSALAKYLR
jgi:hypothetical protein